MTRWQIALAAVLALGLAGCGQGEQGEPAAEADNVAEAEGSAAPETASDTTDDATEEPVEDAGDAESAPEDQAAAASMPDPIVEAPDDVVELSWDQAQDIFLNTYRSNPNTITTDSGLMYQVIEEGEGASPGPRDRVEVHYEGRLVDGSIFDSSYERGETATFPLDLVIPGWTEGLQYMTPGSTFQFVIPYQLAYGEEGRPPVIPPRAVLIFRVELFNVMPANAPQE